MKIFQCSACEHTVFFENVQCLNCQSELGFFPEGGMLALPQSGLYPCRNYTEHSVCNWLTRREGDYCRACRLNRTIPDLTVEGNRQRWYHLEVAKKRLVFSLLELELPLDDLKFDFLVPGAQPVLTGYSDGLVTINATEADSPTREKMRVDMNEPYRTLLGHFRHESAHHYWTVLVKDEWLPKYREVFGDDRQDYQQSMDRYYKEGPPLDWAEHFISAYASMHPWEDWAESWAHYLHMADTLQTSRQFGLCGQYQDFDQMVKDWSQLTFALNSINRSMGISDLYPFVISQPVLTKLRWIHNRLNA